MNAIDAFAILGAIIASLVAYIFINFTSNTQGRFAHQDKLIEEMVANNTHLSKIITDHDYRLRNVEAKLNVNIGEYKETHG